LYLLSVVQYWRERDLLVGADWSGKDSRCKGALCAAPHLFLTSRATHSGPLFTKMGNAACGTIFQCWYARWQRRRFRLRALASGSWSTSQYHPLTSRRHARSWRKYRSILSCWGLASKFAPSALPHDKRGRYETTWCWRTFTRALKKEPSNQFVTTLLTRSRWPALSSMGWIKAGFECSNFARRFRIIFATATSWFPFDPEGPGDRASLQFGRLSCFAWSDWTLVRPLLSSIAGKSRWVLRGAMVG